MHGASESTGRPRPFAVGVLALPAPVDPQRRAAARLDLALDTYKFGYFLLDTVEIGAHGTGCLAVELLVRRTTPAALVIRGPLDSDWLHALADRHRLVIRSGDETPGRPLTLDRAPGRAPDRPRHPRPGPAGA